MTLDAELDDWQPAGHAVRIEYSRAVMDQLRMQVTEGFNRIAHGGVEVGGILFGFHEQDTIRVLAHRELTCEYAFGPSFTLSPQDRSTLDELLCAPATDEELRSMQPVGWYRSNTRSGIRLSEQDLQLYDEYFAEPWQVALVLRPDCFEPVRAGFFFREPDGTVNAGATLQEFLIAPDGRKPVTPALPRRLDEPPPLQTGVPPLDHVPEAPRLASLPLTPRQTLIVPARSSVSWVWIALAIVALLAVGLFAIARSGGADISLRAIDIGSEHLRISWEHNARAIQHSAGGELNIQDGASSIRADLSRELLLTGQVFYLRTSRQVAVKLTLRNADGGVATDATNFTGPPVEVAAAPLPGNSPAASLAPFEKVPDKIPQKASSPQREPKADRASELSMPATAARPVQLPDPTQATAAAHRRPWVPPIERAPSAPAELPSPPAIAANAPAPIAPITLNAPLRAAPKLPDQGPSSGKLIWTGSLPRGGTIVIQGNHASRGRLTAGLPGLPVRVRVFPTELTQSGLKVFTSDASSGGVPEAAGAQNGWMQTTWLLNPRKAGELRIVEAPAPENGWNRLSVKAERGDHTVIVLNWERLPGGR